MSWSRFFRRRRADAEVQAEMDAFLAEEAAENVARGMPDDEAQRRARIKLGNRQRVREALWQQNTWSMLEKFGHDLKYAVRTLVRTPGFSLIAIVVITLCIGAATSLFTIMRSVLLRPLPFRDPEKLVMLYEHFRNASDNIGGFNYNVVSPADFYDWRSQTHGFEDMAAWRYAQFNLTGEQGELPELVTGAGGSWNVFTLLGVQPAFGRTFTESEDRIDSDAVMLTWSLFQRRFGGDPAIVGRQIHLSSKPYTVIGVLPKWFTYPDAKMQLWVTYASGMPPVVLQHHDYHFTRVIARLRPDVKLESAVSQVEALQYRLHLQYPTQPVAEDVAPRTMNEDLARNVKKPLIVLMCAVGCMLLIGCLNVANLLVARGAARQKEVAIRSALGAQRSTLIREQLTESVLICIAGGVSGILLSMAATRWLASTWKDLPSAQSIHVDGSVLVFACGLVFAAALLAGLLPALSTTGKSVIAGLQTSSRTGGTSAARTALRKALLTIEIAVTVVLLISAGLLLKSFMRLRSADVGSATENVLTLSYGLPEKKYDSHEKVNAFNEALLERLRVLPGVKAVALGSTLPGAGYGGDDVFTIKEHPPAKPGEDMPDALTRWADPGYFHALQIPMLSGRSFTNDDRLDRARKVIVNRTLVQQYFPGEDPIGRHLHVPAHNDVDFEVVGVAADTLWRVDQPLKPTMYFPILEGGSENGYALAIRTASDPLSFSVPVEKQIAAIDPELPVSDVLTMDQVIGESLGNARFSATLVLAFAILSLLLASVGLYGVLSYVMTQRITELGIRIALGARREQVLQLMLLDGLRPAILGLAFGLVASIVTTRIFRSMLYGTKPLDPAVLCGVAAALLLVAVLACLMPAWRASRLDPMQAIRVE
jgi:putative ABC transport system permease protein